MQSALSAGVSARIFSTSSMKPMLSISSGLVQHYRADVLDIQGVTLDQVEQTPRRADYHIHTAVEAQMCGPYGCPP